MILTKHQRIRNDLSTKIKRGILRPGAALPSQQQLMAEYDAAQGTVRQALDRLQSDGLVVAQRGKGTFVRQPDETTPAPAATMIGLVMIGRTTPDVLADRILPAFQRAAAPHALDTTIRYFDHTEEDAIVEWAGRVDGVAIWSSATLATLERMVQQEIPAVVMGELLDGECPGGAGWVHYDIPGTIAMAMQMLTAQGHRRIWYLNREGSFYYAQLGQAFQSYIRQAGLTESVRMLVLPKLEDEPTILAHLEAAAEKPTALLIEGDYRSCRFIHMLQQGGWPVPQRLGVMSLGAADPVLLSVSNLYRILTPPDVGMARTVDALADMLRTGRAVRHIIPPQLEVGRTCGSPAAT